MNMHARDMLHDSLLIDQKNEVQEGLFTLEEFDFCFITDEKRIGFNINYNVDNVPQTNK